MPKPVHIAVIPVAGFGTRFLPQTKAMPKEMLPLVDKPIVQWVVEMAVKGGITDIVFVTGWHKRAIEDHFDHHPELDNKLQGSGKLAELEKVRKIEGLANFMFVRQGEARGNGDAILSAEHITRDEPFIVFWGDEFIEADPPVAAQLIQAYKQTGNTVLTGLNRPSLADSKRFGYAGGETLKDGLMKVQTIIEKPQEGERPSDLAIFGGLFTPEIFPALRQAQVKVAPGQELVYVDGVKELLARNTKVYAQEITGGKYVDCGTKLSYLQAVVDMALEDEELGADFKSYIQSKTPN